MLKSKLRSYVSDLVVDLRFQMKLRMGKIHFPNLPMIESRLLEFFEDSRNIHLNLIEFGSGASTIHFSKYFKSIVSIETSRNWSRLVKSEIKCKGLTNVTLRVEKIGPTGQGGIPIFKGISKIFLFPSYFYCTKAFKDNTFEIVFIDGRYRLACFIYALKSNRQTSFEIIFDDYFDDRNEYAGILESKDIEIERIGRAALIKVTNAQELYSRFSRLDRIGSLKNYN